MAAAYEDELEQAIPIVESRLYFAVLTAPEELRFSPLAAASVCFSCDSDLVYEPFFADFGPLNMACAYRFCQRALAALEEASQSRPPRKVFFCTTDDPHRKTNAAVLVGALSVMHLRRTVEDAYRQLLPLKPFAPFRDASCGPSTYHLTVLDCLRGLARARDARLLDFRAPAGASLSAFDLEAYEHYERVENGDLNWVLPGKLIAFSGPHARRARWAGFQSLAPEDYWAPFRSAGVTAVVRLNKRLYDRRRFTEGGFRHHELFFPDGSCPTPQLVERFCSLVEAEPGVVAVHCKAGLGRTGVLVGLFLMKHYSFTANEALGYLRIVRPGSIIGPQQHFLRDWERRMWAQGDAFRSAANQPPRLPQPRISHGGGGAYDDGDISDEDADVGPAEEEYDDGGYTCGSPASLAAQQQKREAPQATAVVVQPSMPVHAAGPSALRTSPTKPLHSGTRPSLLQASGKAPLPSSRTMPARSAAQLRRGGGAQGSVSGDEGPLRRAGNDEASLRRSGSFGGAAAFGVQSLERDGTSRASPPKPAAALGASLRRSGSLPARDATHAAQQAQPRAAATQGVAERMGVLRRSMLATLSPDRAPERASTLSSSSPGGVRLAASLAPGLAPGTPDEGLLRTISALTPGTSCSSGSAGGFTPGSGSALRLVTASGQPRKLPAAAAGSEACLTGTYANAYIGARVSPGGSPHGSPPLNLSPAMAALAMGKLELMR